MKYQLTGEWTLRDENSQKEWPGYLPGYNYLDLLHAGEIDDPFWGQNEDRYKQIAEHDYSYSRAFDLPEAAFLQKRIDLVISGLDTLTVITVNGKMLARTNNCHRTYRFPVKDILKQQGNQINILIQSPVPYIEARQAKQPLVSANDGIKGIGHLRKAQCHFGWDWGPNLPPAGIFGDIYLEAYTARIEDIQIRQQHLQGHVGLQIETALSGQWGDMELRCKLIHPDGGIQENRYPCAKNMQCNISVSNPQLWWCNGLGKQPLYKLQLELLADGAVLDNVEKNIGLRTIALDTDEDKWGGQFQFQINGVSIFAKGANWIPTDSFVTRTTREDLKFYIESAKTANMNMMRVWGGGFYESDAFYDLCDQCGILVWQDFAFACGSYPFYNADFIETVEQEVIDNVKRIRHHASLALWCGNNENEQFAMLWKHNRKLYKSNMQFYFETLKSWVAALDPETPYWPGSPSCGKRGMKPNHMGYGDNHLWQVWHGLMPIEAFRKMPTRFCSEFGVESFPSMRAVRAFTDKENPDILDPVMLTHQKSKGGNQKILFYLLAKYRNPERFSDFAYLSQLVQSNAIRFASDEWRRRRGRCNGSLYWQYNDCWPVASWAGIDYCKQYKALHYHARHFNRPICLSNDYFKNRAEIYLANDLPRDVCATLEWGFYDFAGSCIQSGNIQVNVKALQSKKMLTLPYKDYLNGRKKEEAVLQAVLHVDGKETDRKLWLLVPDKYAKLKSPHITRSIRIHDGIAEITLQSDTYARYTYAELESVTAPFSDNFFDIMGSGSCAVTVPVPDGSSEEALMRQLHIKTLADVQPKNSMLRDRLKRFSMRFQKTNFITWIGYKFIR